MDEQNLVSWKHKGEFCFYSQSIIKNDKFTKLLKLLSKSTGFGFKIVDYRGEVLCDPIKMSGFCENAKQIGHIKELCKTSDGYGVIQSAIGKNVHYFYCPCGLLQISVPIIIDGVFLGGIISGPVRCDQKQERLSTFESISDEDKRKLKENEICQKGYSDIEVISFKHFLEKAEMIAFVIQEFIESEYKLLVKEVEKQQLEEALEAKQKEIVRYQKKPQNRVIAFSNSMLLNCLNTIACLATIENAYQTNDATITLVDLVREAIVDQNKDKLLEKELTQIEKYLLIHQFRFGENRLTYTIKNNVKESKQIVIPPGILLPLIENIVTNSVIGAKEQCHIEMTAMTIEDILEISIYDNCPNGSGKFLKDDYIMKNDPDGSVGFMLEQFKKRMHHELNEKCQIQITMDKNNHTMIKLKIHFK